jgi:PHD/YefM family antitoxin component YafN of YafNO toxin-antitoxin module
LILAPYFAYDKGIIFEMKGTDDMQPVIKPSSELRKNYNHVANICRTNKIPVFLTLNGEGDMVLMDIETYSRREESLAAAERLMSAEMARFMGTQGYTVEQFQQNMQQAIKQGTGKNG